MIAIDPVEYGQLLANTRPKVIETEAEFREARKLLESLTLADRELSPAELALRALLKKLVTDYDDRIHPLPKIEARKLVRRLLEQRELKQKDLIPVLGASSAVSDILSGKRSISKSQGRSSPSSFASRWNILSSG